MDNNHNDNDTKKAKIIGNDHDENRAAKQTKEEFMEVYNIISEEMIKSLPENYSSVAVNYIKEMLDYNVPGGKMNRGLTVAAGLEKLYQSNNDHHHHHHHHRSLTDDEFFKANVLGWCVEWLQAFFLVSDDLMDASVTRRGQPCWYKKPNVGVVAVNDSFILESFVYRLITRYFNDVPYYLSLLETFHEVAFQTELGQLLDLTTQPPNAPINLDDFTVKRYKQIVQYKTAYYSFYLPVKLAMIMKGITDKSAFQYAERICLEMGEYFQIQDDFLDCFGDPSTIGKIGTDIQDGKCSWLVVTALHSSNATPQQLSIIRTHYAHHDQTSIEKIKQLYEELGMKKRFADYEDSSAEHIKKLIQDPTIPSSLNPAIFYDLFDKIYKRKL